MVQWLCFRITQLGDRRNADNMQKKAALTRNLVRINGGENGWENPDRQSWNKQLEILTHLVIETPSECWWVSSSIEFVIFLLIFLSNISGIWFSSSEPLLAAKPHVCGLKWVSWVSWEDQSLRLQINFRHVWVTLICVDRRNLQTGPQCLYRSEPQRRSRPNGQTESPPHCAAGRRSRARSRHSCLSGVCLSAARRSLRAATPICWDPSLSQSMAGDICQHV